MERNYYSADYELVCPHCGIINGLTITAQDGDALTPGHHMDLKTRCIYQCVTCGEDLNVGKRIELRIMPCIQCEQCGERIDPHITGESRTARLENGQYVWFERDKDGIPWIFFEGAGGKFDRHTGHRAPVNIDDRRYTHGGRLYREACQKLRVFSPPQPLDGHTAGCGGTIICHNCAGLLHF